MPIYGGRRYVFNERALRHTSHSMDDFLTLQPARCSVLQGSLVPGRKTVPSGRVRSFACGRGRRFTNDWPGTRLAVTFFSTISAGTAWQATLHLSRANRQMSASHSFMKWQRRVEVICVGGEQLPPVRTDVWRLDYLSPVVRSIYVACERELERHHRCPQRCRTSNTTKVQRLAGLPRRTGGAIIDPA